MRELLRKYSAWVLLAILIVMFIPWLGETLFNTKGEPREAIVALSMLQTGDWILPVSFGQEIPYKPPFFAWCIAVVSLLGGHVTEFTSRFPSAVAAIAMGMATYKFVFDYGRSRRVAFVTALVMVTSVEVWRAASACRVDMVLTACMVGALYSLFTFFEKKRKWLPWLAIFLMSCAFLTKGPVGVFLPCLCIGVYRLLRGDRFWPLFGRLVASGILSCVLPVLWYIAAYNQGGEEFFNLMMEENFGRLSGTMSYESHVNPFYYNFITVIAGMLPYTLVALIGLITYIALRCQSMSRKEPVARQEWRVRWYRFRNMDPTKLYSIVCIVVIFVFYCIPKSKRSVYLLPIYPFLAYFTTLMIFWLVNNHRKVFKIYYWVISIVALGFALLSATACYMSTDRTILLVPALAIGGFTLFMERYFAKISMKRLIEVLGFTVMIYTGLSAYFLPVILSSKSDYPIAVAVAEDYPSGVIYEYIEDPYLRMYELNFYLGDRLRIFDEKTRPEGPGLLLVGNADLDALLSRFGDSYEFQHIKEYTKPEPLFSRPKNLDRQLYSFKRKQ